MAERPYRASHPLLRHDFWRLHQRSKPCYSNTCSCTQHGRKTPSHSRTPSPRNGSVKQYFSTAAQTFETKLQPGNDESDFVHAFAVAGRSVVTKYVKFSTKAVPQLEPGKSIKLVLQGLVDESDSWVGLKTLDIHVGTLVDSFLTMSNNPDHWQSSTLASGRQHQEALMEYLLEQRKDLRVRTGDSA